jgi:ATP-dependent RNA helicase SUPV3L1/SUV3
MLEHESGMIGLPLRLLAREVYDRVSTRVGEGAVALVTGEEKRIPVRPRYWVCTVEAMPVDLAVDFLAVDEVQLATHRQRGHVFTDRLLRARGVKETWFLGSATVRPLLARLCPTAEIESRPRLSTLSDAGSMTLSALPPRSVVVAFSATRVYELAERVRGKRGGAAVVIGALSPRARNAQVALFQSGEVDTLVATDAIGMGLNLDVDNVVFADLRKFDGQKTRALEDAELAQIAGRAGRHQRDGRFATLDPLLPLPVATVRALERHQFPADERVFWRNHALDFDSIEGLVASLRRRPTAPYLSLADDAEDLRAVLALSRMDDVMAAVKAGGAEAVPLLWEICQVPDFRQLPFDDHFKLLGASYLQLMRHGRLQRPWVEGHLHRLDRVDGDLETLLDRMSAVRTWTYITAHRSSPAAGGAVWVEDAAGFQARSHALEDRLSDALHAQLVARFVEVPGKRGRRAVAAKAPAGTLAAQLAAKIPAARATAEPAEDRGAARLEALIEATHAQLAVAADGRISFLAAGPPTVVGRLVRGADLLHPDVNVAGALGAAGAQLRISRRLLAFARDLVAELLAPFGLLRDSRLGPAGRGLVYQLEQSLGSVPAEAAPLAELSGSDRRILRGAGLVVGRLAVYAPPLVTADALRKRWALCAAELWPEQSLARVVGSGFGGAGDAAALTAETTAPSVLAGGDLPPRLCGALGYPVCGGLAVRADVLEAVGRELARGASATRVAAQLGVAAPAVTALVAEARALVQRSEGRVRVAKT